MTNRIGVSSFALRQFYGYTSLEKIEDGDFDYIPVTPRNFVDQLKSRLDRGQGKWINGYAPFCKGIIIKNWTDALNSWTKINKNN